MPFVERNGVRIFYETRGDGLPVVLLAGLGSDGHPWDAVANILAERFTVIVPDNRGVGRSDSPEEPFSVADMAADVAGLLDALGVFSAHVVGHSLGGYIAQEFAIRFPRRVDKLVLSNTAAVSSARNNSLIRNAVRARQSGYPPEIWVRGLLYWLYAPGRFESATFEKLAVRNAVRYPYQQTTDGYAKQVDAVIGFDSRARLDEIQAETLCITGAEEFLVMPRETRFLADRIPKARGLVVLEGTAHVPHLEIPKKFAAVISGFLASE